MLAIWVVVAAPRTMLLAKVPELSTSMVPPSMLGVDPPRVDVLIVWLVFWAAAGRPWTNRPRLQAAVTRRRRRRLMQVLSWTRAAPMVKPFKTIAKTAPWDVALHTGCRECIAEIS